MLFLYVEFLAVILQKNLTFNSSKSGNLCYLFVFFSSIIHYKHLTSQSVNT